MIGMSLKTRGFGNAFSLLSAVKAFGGDGHKAVVTDVPYAPYQEFGTSRMQAQPHVRPAAEEVKANRRHYLRKANDIEEAVELATIDLQKRIRRKAPVDTGRLRDSYEVIDKE